MSVESEVTITLKQFIKDLKGVYSIYGDLPVGLSDETNVRGNHFSLVVYDGYLMIMNRQQATDLQNEQEKKNGR